MPYTLSEIERAALHYQQRAQAIKTALQSALLIAARQRRDITILDIFTDYLLSTMS